VNKCRIWLAISLTLLLSVCNAQEDKEQQTNSVGMKFEAIPAGEFMMGRGRPYSDILRLTTIHAGVDRAIKTEVPQHRVRIAPFRLATTEVTQKQWEDVMGSRPWHQKHSFVKEGPDFPATYVTWEQAREFCQRLSRKEGKTYRLPTEAEWEYACRAQTTTIFAFGDDSSKMKDFGWIADNAYSIGESFAHRVARQKPNAWGLYDMHGNVWEWCGDRYNDNYYAHAPVNNPKGPPDGTKRVIRGGSWRDSDTHARSAFRFGVLPSRADMNIGFRVVCELTNKPADSN
jgi:formylglycine-generating enzyme required for sulfatase activity